MPQFFSISTSTTGAVRLYHGTDVESAQRIAGSGVIYESALRCGGTGEFWTSYDRSDAVTFAQSNLASGPPGIVSFNLPTAVIQHCLFQPIPWAWLHHGDAHIEFLRPSFPILNESITNCHVELLE